LYLVKNTLHDGRQWQFTSLPLTQKFSSNFNVSHGSFLAAQGVCTPELAMLLRETFYIFQKERFSN